MERRRFKPIIDEKRVKEMFSRKRFKYESTRDKIKNKERTLVKELEYIPSSLRPITKKYNATRTRDILNQEHWEKPTQQERKSRDDILKTERVNLNKTVRLTQNWSRSAKALGLALQPQKPKQSSIDEI